MSILQISKIDFISTSKKTGAILLTITDHLDWTDESFHLKALQEKLNSYIQFIESGQIYKEYPKSIGQQMIIQIVSKYAYNDKGKEFLGFARPIIASIGARLIQITGSDPEDLSRVSEMDKEGAKMPTFAPGL